MRPQLKHLPWLAGMFALIVALYPVFKSHNADGFDMDALAALPVQHGGRVMPLDTLARNQLKMISGKTAVEVDGKTMPAIRWLMELTARPEVADTWKVFRMDHPELLGRFGWSHSDGKFYSFAQLQPHFMTLDEETRSLLERENRFGLTADDRTPYQRSLMSLRGKLDRYHRLSQSLHPLGGLDNLTQEYMTWQMSVEPGSAALNAQIAGEPYDVMAFNRFTVLADRYMRLQQDVDVGLRPAEDPERPWLTVGELLLETLATAQLDPVALAHAELVESWRRGDSETFNASVASLQSAVDAGNKPVIEHHLNVASPFTMAMVYYIVALVVLCAYFIVRHESLRTSAAALIVAAFLIHTVSLAIRVYLQGRPPVTNLYSSAIFCGWGAVLLGLLFERFNRDGFGGFAASMVGFSTLVIAPALTSTSSNGDTLEPMRAVLASDFWLTTHVIIVTLGYSAMFLAGKIGCFYVVRRATQRSETAEAKRFDRRLYGQAYGITCFGLLFSFIGTMLGGIWADQSWGRFWGWDPKENGALMIVLWSALMLHARFGGVVQLRGFMLLAIFGNIITAWSWFGTNMLGIGLHSYGFMDQAFVSLYLYWFSQVGFIALGCLPEGAFSQLVRRVVRPPNRAVPPSA